LLDEDAILIAGAEIDVDAVDLVAREGEEFGVSKALAALGHAFIGHKRFVALDKDSLQFVPFDPVAVAPAALKIGRLVDPVVIGTGKTEVVGERVLDGLAVIRAIGGKKSAEDSALLRAVMSISSPAAPSLAIPNKGTTNETPADRHFG
jgi:hypothetical protein